MRPPLIKAQDILEGLNPQQKEAVLATEGPVLVIAGAGSGKTRVLTHRIAYLIGVKGIPPTSILAMTFTNKAAEEMMERLRNLLGSTISGMWVGTFHSICVRILRKHIDKLGYSKNFTIYDRDDQKSVVKELEPEWEERPGSIVSRISRYKNGSYFPEDEREISLFKKYEEILKKSNALDFDDLLLKTIDLFEKFPDIRKIYAERFRYIHVDEYQDTNRAQYIILRHLSSIHKNLFVVGDEDQSIYGFRGADIRNILEFEKDFKDARVIRLEENYRSTKMIVRAATSLISHNKLRKGKNLWTRNSKGKKIMVVETRSEREEAELVADYIKRKGNDYRDFLVLYRTNAQSRALEEAMRRWQIPHIVVGTVRFYERKEIKDLLAYLKILVNPKDDLSLKRIINVPPRGIGRKTVEILENYASLNGLSLFEILKRVSGIEELKEGVKEKLADFLDLILDLSDMGDNVYMVLETLIERTGYIEYLRGMGESWEANSRIENVEELLGSVQEFVRESEGGSVEDYINSVILKSDIDEWEEKENAVVLMTVHNAKGLEFPFVIVTGLEDGTFPHRSSFTEDFGLEEERRLFHVALTRAKEEVLITYARERFTGRRSNLNPSRFLMEIDPETLFWPQAKNYGKDGEEIKRGDIVYHSMFGKGEVLEVYDGKAKILFSGGVRTLVLEFAKLKKL
jgi:DNA helicase-2/ATP-dependent DNA helicase PcrA